MKWVKERDLFIAQTLAFVQSVTGKKPEIESRAEPAPAASANVAAAKSAEPPLTAHVPRMAPVSPGDVRLEMQKHIANFRAHQERFHREREEYFRATLAKARTGMGSESAAPRSPK